MVRDQDFEVRFNGGVDRKYADDTIIPNKLKVLENAVFEDKDTIVQRGGHSLVHSTTLQLLRRLWTHKGEVYADGVGDVYRMALNTALNLTRMVRASKLESPVSNAIQRNWAAADHTVNKSTNFDVVASEDFSLWAWEERDPNYVWFGATAVPDAPTNIRYKMVRESDKVVVASGSIGHGYSPRVVYCSGTSRFFLYYVGSVGEIEGRRFTESSTPTTTAITVAVSPHLNDTYTYDVDARGSAIVLALNPTGTDDIQVLTLSSTDGATVLTNRSQTLSDPPRAVTALTTMDSNSDPYHWALFWHAGGPEDLLAVVDDGSALSGELTIASGAGSTYNGRIAAIDADYGEGDDITIFFDNRSVSSAYLGNQILKTTVGKNGVGAVAATTVRTGWYIYGRPCTAAPGKLLPAAVIEAEGSSVYLLDVEATPIAGNEAPVVARIAPGEVSYLYDEWNAEMRVPACPVIASGETVVVAFSKWVEDLQVAEGLGGLADGIITPYVIHRADVDFNSQLGSLEVNGLSLLAGACPHFFDGEAIFEAGPHHRDYLFDAVTGAPVAPNIVLPAALANGTMYVATLQQHTDAVGNTHFGQPSNIRQVSISGAPTDINLTMTRQSSPRGVNIYSSAPYRTPLSSTGPLYRAHDRRGLEVAESAFAPTNPYALVPDVMYSTGAAGEELVNEACPSFRQASYWQKRIWLAGCDDGYNIYFSKQVTPGFGPGFNRSLRRRVPESWGRVVAVHPLGDRLVVFCERKIGQIYGQGPTDTGEQDGYTEPLPLVEGYGMPWRSPLAAAVTSDGIWFQSLHGLRCVGMMGGILMDQQGGEMGSEVDGLGSATPTLHVAQMVDTQQVMFYDNSSSTHFCWDSKYKQWSTFSTPFICYGLAIGVDDDLKILASNKLLEYDTSVYLDDVTAFNAVATTAPLKMAGVLGFQRIKRVQLQGRSDADTTIAMSAYYDDSTSATVLFTSETITPVGSRIAIEHHLARQKCESIQFQITWKSTEARARLTALKLRAGVKSGHAKMPSSRRY